MNFITEIILTIVADKLLIPLIKNLLTYIVDPDNKNTGVSNIDFTDLEDLMKKSVRNKW